MRRTFLCVLVLALSAWVSSCCAITEPPYSMIASAPIVAAEQFGVTADGVTNDFASLTAALTYCRANGAHLMLPDGTTYIGANTITVASGDVIMGRGIDRSIIAADPVAGTHIFDTYNAESATQTLTATFTIGSQFLSSAISSSVATGDFVIVSYTNSNSSAYRFTAEWGLISNSYVKGEINVVQDIFGGNLLLAYPALFEIGMASSSVTSIHPVTGLRLEDFTIQIASTTALTVGGIYLRGCRDAVVRNVKITGFTWAGVHLRNSIGCRLENISGLAGPAEPVGLGYGVLYESGARGNSWRGGDFSHCRHGIAHGGDWGGICYANTSECLAIASGSGGIATSTGQRLASVDFHASSFQNVVRDVQCDSGIAISGIGNIADNIRGTGGFIESTEGGTDNVISNCFYYTCDGFRELWPVRRLHIRDSSFFFRNVPYFDWDLTAGTTDLDITNTFWGYIATGTTNTDWSTGIGNSAQYGLVLNANSRVTNTIVSGFPTGLFIRGSGCTVSNVQLINCGWNHDTITNYESAIFINETDHATVKDVSIYLYAPATYSSNCLLLQDTVLASESNFIGTTLQNIYYASGSMQPFNFQFTQVGTFTESYFTNVRLGTAAISAPDASGTFIHNTIATNTY